MKTFKLVYLSVVIMLGATTACTDKQSSVSSHMKKGKAFLEVGDYSKARIEFKNVLQIDSKNTETYVLLGKTEESESNWKRAFANYNKAVDIDPGNIVAQVSLGRIYLLSGDFDAAKQKMEIVLSLNSQSYDGLMLKAVLLDQKKEKSAAIDVLLNILSKYPDKREAVTLLANVYIQQNSLNKATEVINKALLSPHNKNNIQLMVQLAQVYVATLKMDEAENILSKIISIEPDDMQHRVNLSSFYAKRKRLKDAENVLRQAVSAKPEDENRYLLLVDFLDTNKGESIAEQELSYFVGGMPKSLILRFALAGLYDRNLKTQEAIKQYKEIIKLDDLSPDAIKAKNSLATLLLREGRQIEAAIYVDEVLSENPHDNDALKLKGQLALSLGDASTAIIYFRSVLKNQPDSFVIVNLLATSYAMNNEPKLAVNILQKFLDAKPNNVDAMLLLAQYLSQDGYNDIAIEQLDKVLATSKSNISAMQLKATILVAKKSVDAALDLLKQVQHLHPNNLDNYKQLGDLYFQKGEYFLAIDEYEKALKISGKQLPYMASITMAYLKAKQPDRAIERINQQLSGSSETAVLHELLAEIYIYTKQYKKAKASLDKAIKQKPDWNLLYTTLATMQYEQGQKRSAVNTYKKGLQRIPGDERLSAELAEIYENHYAFDEAIALYKAILLKNPTNQLAANNLASILANHKNDEANLKFALELVSGFESSKNPVYLDTLGWVLYKTGKTNRAIDLISKAVNAAPEVPHLHYHLGMAYYNSDKDKAKFHLAKALDSKLNFPGRDDAVKAIMTIR